MPRSRHLPLTRCRNDSPTGLPAPTSCPHAGPPPAEVKHLACPKFSLCPSRIPRSRHWQHVLSAPTSRRCRTHSPAAAPRAPGACPCTPAVASDSLRGSPSSPPGLLAVLHTLAPGPLHRLVPPQAAHLPQTVSKSPRMPCKRGGAPRPPPLLLRASPAGASPFPPGWHILMTHVVSCLLLPLIPKALSSLTQTPPVPGTAPRTQ